MSFVSFRDAITTKLNTVSKLQEVYNRPKTDFTGFPVAIVVPADNTALYDTVTQNERAYGFSIFCIYDLKNETVENSYDAMYDLIDDIINLFDEDPLLTGTLSLPAKYCIITVEPAPAEWGEDPELQQLWARVDLRCRVLFDTK